MHFCLNNVPCWHNMGAPLPFLCGLGSDIPMRREDAAARRAGSHRLRATRGHAALEVIPDLQDEQRKEPLR